MKYNYNKLKGLIIEMYGSQKKFTKEIGMSERSLSLKLNNKVPFTQPEIECIVDKLNIEAVEIPIYFFIKQVQ